MFVVIEHGSRILIHYKVTAHPTAAWTLQQPREVVGYGDRYQFLIHDRDCIFARKFDESIRALGMRVFESAVHSPRINSICERVIGTIPARMPGLADPTVRITSALKSWIAHYNGGRPHMSFGPGIRDSPAITKALPESSARHCHGESYAVRTASNRGGLHNETFADACQRVTA
jgi:putative transposase